MWLTEEMSRLGQYWQFAETLVTVNPNANGTQLVPRNSLRWSLEITLAWPPAASAQVGTDAGQFFSAIGPGKDLSLGGVVVLQQNMDAKKGGRLTGATALVTGGGTVALQIARGAQTLNLASTTTTFALSGHVMLEANDIIQWNNTVGALGSTADLFLGGELFDQFGVSLSVLSTADRTQGRKLYVGGEPARYNYRNDGGIAQSDWYASNLSQTVRQQVLVREVLLVQ